MHDRHTIDSRLETEKIGGSHIRIAQPGDTLHAIAFANGLNVNDVAAWNGVSDTSKLAVGQRIRLTVPLNMPDTPRTGAGKTTASAGAVKSGERHRPPASNAPLRPPREVKASAVQRPTLSWSWPIDGRVITQFNPGAGRQGIDIQGVSGQAVKAALAGEVVYVGNGLKGYGNLVIIKHDVNFLSAYAHNQETFVQEGQQVKGLFRIGSVGRDRQQRDALHFQIRKDGQPVNPLKYLPVRRN